MDEKREKINKILPELEKIQKSVPRKHYIEIFEGKEGLKTIINDLLQKPNETIYIIGAIKKWLKFSEVFSEIYYRKKREKKIHAKALINKSEIKEIKNKKIFGTEFRSLENLTSESECFIYQDKIAFVSFEENSLKGVIIQDLEMAKLQKNIFEKLWNTAKKVSK